MTDSNRDELRALSHPAVHREYQKRDEYWKGRILAMEDRHVERVKTLADIRQKEVRKIKVEAWQFAIDNYTNWRYSHMNIRGPRWTDFLQELIESYEDEDGD